MPWNSTWPVGSISVKANRTIGQQNTTYIETTMGNSVVGTNTNTTRDHFWNVGTNEDGRHRFIQSPAFTVGGNPADPVLGSGMNGVFYFKTVQTRCQGFFRNAEGIFQVFPAIIRGTVNINGNGSGDWKNLSAIPAQSYGEIFLWQTGDGSYIQKGVFASDNTSVRGFSYRQKLNDTSDDYMIELRNNVGSSLTLQAKRGSTGASYDGNWTYVIMYWAK